MTKETYTRQHSSPPKIPVVVSGILFIGGQPAPNGAVLQAVMDGKSRSNYIIGQGPEDM